MLTAPVSAATDIVGQATQVLASELERTAPARTSRQVTGAAPANEWARHLETQVKTLIDQFVALSSQRPRPDVRTPHEITQFNGHDQPTDATPPKAESAPVLVPEGPVATGGTAQINIKLVNDDDHSVEIAFLSTDLVGQGGARIGAENVVFEPREVMLEAGGDGWTQARIRIPANTSCGIYSGLVRASKLDYLRAVLVVDVARLPT